MIYIQDDKTKTVRHYGTSPKVDRAIETLLKQDEELMWSETHEGYVVEIREDKESD